VSSWPHWPRASAILIQPSTLRNLAPTGGSVRIVAHVDTDTFYAAVTVARPEEIQPFLDPLRIRARSVDERGRRGEALPLTTRTMGADLLGHRTPVSRHQRRGRHKLTFDNASAWELNDRSLVRAGYRADLVLFDEARVKPAMPRVETDLPGGARRLVQKAEGIAATVVNGE